MQRLYILVAVFAAGGLWFLYDLGYRGLALAAYRNRLFQLRFVLFKLGVSKQLAYDSNLYRSLEILFNGLIRYAHTVSYYTYREATREMADLAPDSDFSKVLSEIASLPQHTRDEVWILLDHLQRAVATYMACTSPVFLFLAAVAHFKPSVRSIGVFQDKTYVKVFEEEAYRAEKRRTSKQSRLDQLQHSYSA